MAGSIAGYQTIPAASVWSGLWNDDDDVTGLATPLGSARRRALIGMAGLVLTAAQSAAAAPQRPASVISNESLGAPWGRMAVSPGRPVDMRPAPPRAGRNRCIGVDNLAAAQLFGDRAIELTLRNGQRYRMFFARECQALSFYQGFYYRRQKAGQLCAGRDVIGARSGGECPIASILPVRRLRNTDEGS